MTSYYPQQSSDDTIDKNVINVSWKLCPKTCMYYPWSTTGIRGGYYGMGYIIFDTTLVFAFFSRGRLTVVSGECPVRNSKLFKSRAVALKRQTFIEAWKRKHFLNQVVFSAKRQHLYLWILNWCTNFKHRLLTKYYTIQHETNCSNSPIKTAFVRSIIHFCPLFHWIDYFDKPQTAKLNYIYRSASY